MASDGGGAPPHCFRSITILRLRENTGGTGGFNAGLAFVRDELDDGKDPIAFVRLMDDDAFPHEDSLGYQLQAMAEDPGLGIVGVRSVDPDDRETTLESTVYLDWASGHLMDDAPTGHPRHESHRRFLERVGSTRRGRDYAGLIDVDVCAAAGLLARMSVVREVGLWDPRYFIYEYDADWCLRVARRGFRVAACMDAVVFHRTWHARLLPRMNCTRMFYVSRNRLWTMAKVMDAGPRATATAAWHRTLLRYAIDAAWHRRATHACLLLTALDDSLASRGGKIPIAIPAEIPPVEALRRVGALRAGARVVVLCDRAGFVESAAALRQAVRRELRAGEREPAWVELTRNDVPGPALAASEGENVRRVLYSARWRSKMRRQAQFWFDPPTAMVIFDGAGDVAFMPSCPNVHVDRAWNVAQVEEDSVVERLAFTARWVGVAARAWWKRRARAD